RGDDPEVEILEDLFVLRDYCAHLYEDLGCPTVEVSTTRIYHVLAEIQPTLSRNAATPNPSLFKRASAFTIAFMMHSPLDIPFLKADIPEHLKEIPNHHNAIAAFEFCRRNLYGGEIYKRVPGEKTFKREP